MFWGLPFLGFSQGSDWCGKHSRCWLPNLYISFVSVSQRAISFLISDAKLWRILIDSKKFCVFRSISFLISDAKLWRILIDSKKFCVFRSQLLRHRGVFCNRSGGTLTQLSHPPLLKSITAGRFFCYIGFEWSNRMDECNKRTVPLLHKYHGPR